MLGHGFGSDTCMAPTLVWLIHWNGFDIGMTDSDIGILGHRYGSDIGLAPTWVGSEMGILRHGYKCQIT